MIQVSRLNESVRGHRVSLEFVTYGVNTEQSAVVNLSPSAAIELARRLMDAAAPGAIP